MPTASLAASCSIHLSPCTFSGTATVHGYFMDS